MKGVRTKQGTHECHTNQRLLAHLLIASSTLFYGFYREERFMRIAAILLTKLTNYDILTWV